MEGTHTELVQPSFLQSMAEHGGASACGSGEAYFFSVTGKAATWEDLHSTSGDGYGD